MSNITALLTSMVCSGTGSKKWRLSNSCCKGLWPWHL